MIKIESMSETEIQEFKKQRKELGLGERGTTIQFTCNEDIEDVLDTNFEQKWLGQSCDLTERLGFIYSKFPVDIFYVNGSKTLTMKKYGYMEGQDSEYNKGKIVYPIKVFQHTQDESKYRFLMQLGENKYIEYKPIGKRVSTSSSPVKLSELSGYTQVGTFTYTLGQRIDKKYFDPSKPKVPTSASNEFCDYDSKIFDEVKYYEPSLCKPVMVRNNQVIGLFEIEKLSSVSSARGGPESRHKIYHVRAELSYETMSAQNNVLDEISKIQENKNQWEPDFPKSLIRLLSEGKELGHKEIWSYFVNKTNPPRVSKNGTVLDRELEVSLDAPKQTARLAKVKEVASRVTMSNMNPPLSTPKSKTTSVVSTKSPVQSKLPEAPKSPEPKDPKSVSIEDDISVDDEPIFNIPLTQIKLNKKVEEQKEEQQKEQEEQEEPTEQQEEEAQEQEQQLSQEPEQVEEIQEEAPSKYYLCSDVIQFVNTKSLNHESLIKVAKALMKPANKDNFHAMMSVLSEKVITHMITMCLQNLPLDTEVISKRTLGDVEIKSSWTSYLPSLF